MTVLLLGSDQTGKTNLLKSLKVECSLDTCGGIGSDRSEGGGGGVKGKGGREGGEEGEGGGEGKEEERRGGKERRRGGG